MTDIGSSSFRDQSVQPTRRQFARTLAGAGLGILGVPALLRGRGLAEKLNIALVGVGGRGADNLKALSGENIVALCDVDEHTPGRSRQGPSPGQDV